MISADRFPSNRAFFSDELHVLRAIILSLTLSVNRRLFPSLEGEESLKDEKLAAIDYQQELGFSKMARMDPGQFTRLYKFLSDAKMRTMGWAKYINTFWWYLIPIEQRPELFLPGFEAGPTTIRLVNHIMAVDGAARLIVDMMIYRGTRNCSAAEMHRRADESITKYGFLHTRKPGTNHPSDTVVIYRHLVEGLVLERFFSAVEKHPFPSCLYGFFDGQQEFQAVLKEIETTHVPDFMQTVERCDVKGEIQKYAAMDDGVAARILEQISKVRCVEPKQSKLGDSAFALECPEPSTPEITEEEEEEEQFYEITDLRASTRPKRIPFQRSDAFVVDVVKEGSDDWS